MQARQNWFDLHDETLTVPDVAIFGLPFDGSVSRRAGQSMAPARLRELSRTADPISRRGRRVTSATVRDFGDVPATDPRGGTLSPERFLESAAARLQVAPEGSFLLCLGGDNSVSTPALRAFSARHEGDVGVVWFDAHPDLFETYDGSPNSHACALRRSMSLCGLEPAQVALVGTRSFAEEELRFIESEDVLCIRAAEWAASTPADVVGRLVERLGGRRAVYLAVDIDGFDSACAPGTGYPMPGGVGAEAFFTFQEELFRRLPVRAMDITEIAPPLDVNDVTSFLGVQLVLEALALLEVR